jgi:hypothetical protein
MEAIMRILKVVATALTLSVGAMTFSAPAQANANDAIIAGAAGFAVGTAFGSAAYPRGYYPRYGAYRPYYPRAYYPRRAYYRPYYRSYYGPYTYRCWNTNHCY